MKDKRSYEIMLLRDQGFSFTDIAKQYDIKYGRVAYYYQRLKVKQIILYINHIAFTLGHATKKEILSVFNAAIDFYCSFTYACAYLEMKYKDILDEYRQGEPGMPEEFIKALPPFKKKVSGKVVLRIVEMRDVEKATFTKIAEELHITGEKAKQEYDGYYRSKINEYINGLPRDSIEYKKLNDAEFRVVNNNISSKRQYDMLTGNTNSN